MMEEDEPSTAKLPVEIMRWQVHRVSPEDDSVYLLNLASGSIRHISVPGVEDAWINGKNLIIRCKTGYFWEVDPSSGARRRISNQQGLLL